MKPLTLSSEPTQLEACGVPNIPGDFIDLIGRGGSALGMSAKYSSEIATRESIRPHN